MSVATHICHRLYQHCVSNKVFLLTGDSKGGADDDDEQSILHGLNFCLDGFTEEQEMQLQEDIENYGGNVLSNQSKTIADFLVVPLNYECGKRRATNVVSIGYQVFHWHIFR